MYWCADLGGHILGLLQVVVSLCPDHFLARVNLSYRSGRCFLTRIVDPDDATT